MIKLGTLVKSTSYSEEDSFFLLTFVHFVFN